MFLRVGVIVAVLGLASALQPPVKLFSSESDSIDPEDVVAEPRHRRTSEPVLKDEEPRHNDRLFESLVTDYYDDIEPGNSTTVKFGLGFMCVQFDEQTRILTSTVYVRMVWTDPRLTWKPESFGGRTTFQLPRYRVWYPDIRMFNSLARGDIDYGVNVWVSNNGKVTQVLQSTFKSACLPSGFDNQSYNCTMKFGSWTYDGLTLPLEAFEFSSYEYSGYLPCPYGIENATTNINTVYYACCSEPYQDFTANFTVVKRQ